MKSIAKLFAAVVLVLAAASASFAQTENPKKAEFHIFADNFEGPDGPTSYPQYAWRMSIPSGTMSGYGFGEAVPYEPFFVNNLVIYTPNPAPWFAIHTEVGGYPNKGTHFVQIGPRINVTNAIPRLKKPLDHFFVTALPRFEGIRPNNILAAGGTNPWSIGGGWRMHIDSYGRFFPDRSHYDEHWILVQRKSSHWAVGALIHDNSKNKALTFGLGLRVSLF